MTLGSDLVTGVVSSIIYDGLKRPYKWLNETIVRRRKVGGELLGKITSAPRHQQVDDAVADIVKIIGGYTGQYTESTANFLREFERSALPDAMRQFALSAKDQSALVAPFKMIYDSCEPLPFECEALFRAFSRAIELRVGQSIADPTLFEALKAQNSEVVKQLDILATTIASVTTDIPIRAAELYEVRLRVAKSIEAASRNINVETNQGTRKIKIDSLIIPARLARVDHDLKAINAAEHGQTIGFIPFRRTFHRAVILGDPGGGKSTLTQYLCNALARQIILESQTPLAKRFESSDLRLPLRIVLRALQSRQQKNPSYSILDYLQDDLRSMLDNNAALANRALKQLLAVGQAVVLFDGLDEILEVGARQSMSQIIEAFIHSYPLCPALVTSRIVGYRDAPLSDDFENYILAKFNREEVFKFSERLIAAVGNVSRKIAKEKAVAFLGQTEAAAEDLRKNPLLLGLMVYIFVNKGDVPNNRPEIYKECALLMFEKWDQRRDIIFKFPTDFNLLDLFGYIAGEIFGDAEAEEGVSEEWLLRRIRSFFESWYEDRSKAVAAARLLVAFITGRAWVMCEIGPGSFKFTHRTFLEYFFARRIEEESPGIEQMVRTKLLPKAVLAQWDVVIHLALQIATFRSGPKSLQAATALLNDLNSSTYTSMELLNFLKFLSRTLSYLSLSESRFRDVVRELLERTIIIGSTHDVAAREIIVDICATRSMRLDVILNELSNVLEIALKGPVGPKRDFAIYVLGIRRPEMTKVGRTYVRSGEGAIWDNLKDLRERHRARQLRLASEDVREASNYIFLFGDNVVALYSKWHFALFMTDANNLTPAEMNKLLNTLVMTAIEAAMDRESSGIKFDALQTIRAIATDAAEGKLVSEWKTTKRSGYTPFVAEIDDILYSVYRASVVDRTTREQQAMLADCLLATFVIAEMDGMTGDPKLINSNDKEPPQNEYTIARVLPREVLRQLLERHKKSARFSVIEGWLLGNLSLLHQEVSIPPGQDLG